MLTDSTVYFSYRDADGTYLNDSSIMDYVKMNFSVSQNLS